MQLLSSWAGMMAIIVPAGKDTVGRTRKFGWRRGIGCDPGELFFRGREIGLRKIEHGKIVNQFHADGRIGGIDKTKEVGVYVGILRL